MSTISCIVFSFFCAVVVVMCVHHIMYSVLIFLCVSTKSCIVFSFFSAIVVVVMCICHLPSVHPTPPPSHKTPSCTVYMLIGRMCMPLTTLQNTLEPSLNSCGMLLMNTKSIFSLIACHEIKGKKKKKMVYTRPCLSFFIDHVVL